MNVRDLYTSYPLLASLSEVQREAIDLNVLHEPSEADLMIIDDLGARLDKYVVIYKSNYEPQKGHLCRMIRAAALAPDQIKEVYRAEKQLLEGNKIVVVYEKPLQFK